MTVVTNNVIALRKCRYMYIYIVYPIAKTCTSLPTFFATMYPELYWWL